MCLLGRAIRPSPKLLCIHLQWSLAAVTTTFGADRRGSFKSRAALFLLSEDRTIWLKSRSVNCPACSSFAPSALAQLECPAVALEKCLGPKTPHLLTGRAARTPHASLQCKIPGHLTWGQRQGRGAEAGHAESHGWSNTADRVCSVSVYLVHVASTFP